MVALLRLGFLRRAIEAGVNMEPQFLLRLPHAVWRPDMITYIESITAANIALVGIVLIAGEGFAQTDVTGLWHTVSRCGWYVSPISNRSQPAAPRIVSDSPAIIPTGW
jgi:hypothetical protein